jgi:hypothetical protein
MLWTCGHREFSVVWKYWKWIVDITLPIKNGRWKLKRRVTENMDISMLHDSYVLQA